MPDDLDLSPLRRALDRWAVGLAEPIAASLTRHWLLLFNGLVLLFLGGAVAVPLLRAGGFDDLAAPLYGAYSAMCHQWAFRSFFLFGPAAVYNRASLEALALDPYTFVGNDALGWKLALCERDLAIFSGLLLFGLLYAARWRDRRLRPLGFLLFGVLAAPMALDGLSQLPGWRESTWELRVTTGALFGVASGWLLLPAFDAAIRGRGPSSLEASQA